MGGGGGGGGERTCKRVEMAFPKKESEGGRRGRQHPRVFVKETGADIGGGALAGRRFSECKQG